MAVQAKRVSEWLKMRRKRLVKLGMLTFLVFTRQMRAIRAAWVMYLSLVPHLMAEIPALPPFGSSSRRQCRRSLQLSAESAKGLHLRLVPAHPSPPQLWPVGVWSFLASDLPIFAGRPGADGSGGGAFSQVNLPMEDAGDRRAVWPRGDRRAMLHSRYDCVAPMAETARRAPPHSKYCPRHPRTTKIWACATHAPCRETLLWILRGGVF